MKNKHWMYKSVVIFVAGASETNYWKSKGLPTSGKMTSIGWGNSPKQAYRDSLKNRTYVGNVDTSEVLSDYVYFHNGRVSIRSKYSDNLI
jgi:hypothetical protein